MLSFRDNYLVAAGDVAGHEFYGNQYVDRVEDSTFKPGQTVFHKGRQATFISRTAKHREIEQDGKRIFVAAWRVKEFRSAAVLARLLLTAARNVGTLRDLGDLPGHEFHGNQWTSGAGVTNADVADASIAWASKQYPRADLTEKKATGLDPREKFYKGTVDGLRVLTDIPNTDSIGATFTDSSEYDELPGIREVAIKDLDLGDFSAADDNRRVRDLAASIKESGVIKPLIVVIDGTRKPYILEGGHRAPALKMLGKTKLPAVVIVDHTAQKLRSASARRRRETPIHAAADAHVAKLSVAFRHAFAMGRKALGNPPSADRAAKAVAAALRTTLQPTLIKVLAAGGEAGIAMLSKQLRAAGDVEPQTFTVAKSLTRDEAVTEARKLTKQDFRGVTYDAAIGVLKVLELRALKLPLTKKVGTLNIQFDVQNARAASWALEHAGWLIDDVAQTTRERIQEAIARAQIGGDLQQQRQDIEDAVGDEARANVIARTESMTAANEGQRQGWDQAVEEGLLPADAKRVWIATDVGPCPICEGLDGQEATLGDEYDDAAGGAGPPAHPNCRCTEGIAF